MASTQVESTGIRGSSGSNTKVSWLYPLRSRERSDERFFKRRKKNDHFLKFKNHPNRKRNKRERKKERLRIFYLNDVVEPPSSSDLTPISQKEVSESRKQTSTKTTNSNTHCSQGIWKYVAAATTETGKQEGRKNQPFPLLQVIRRKRKVSYVE